VPGKIQPTAVGGDVPAATTDPREEVLVRFSQGHIVTDESLQFFSVRANIHTLDNRPDGTYEGEYELIEAPADVFNRPDPPVPPFDTPVGPVDHVTINTHTKGLWTFGDGSSIAAIGPANFHAVKMSSGPNGGVMLWVTGDQVITGGTGRYEGVQGLKTLGGSADVPNLPSRPGMLFVARTVDAFRIIRGEHIYRP
jgi:hypothetical protein